MSPVCNSDRVPFIISSVCDSESSKCMVIRATHSDRVPSESFIETWNLWLNMHSIFLSIFTVFIVLNPKSSKLDSDKSFECNVFQTCYSDRVPSYNVFRACVRDRVPSL